MTAIDKFDYFLFPRAIKLAFKEKPYERSNRSTNPQRNAEFLLPSAREVRVHQRSEVSEVRSVVRMGIHAPIRASTRS
jgi:hypothetical protein